MTVIQTQALLVYLGYDPGGIDGIWGPSTQSAVLAFQKDYGGLTTDGYPGPMTDKAMRHAVAYGMPEVKASDPEEQETTPEPQSVPPSTAADGAEQYLQADGYYHVPKSIDIKLSTNFSSREFRCGLGSPCSACSETLVNPKLVQYLQQIHDHFSAPVTITSGYRCTSYNKSIGGATGSRHSKGDAADISVSGVAPRAVAQYAEDMGVLGIGLYESQSDGYFVHVDTRDYKSFWYGQAQAGRTTFK